VRKLVLYCTLLFMCGLFANSAGAVNYFVSPTGDDSYTGLSEDSAWLSIDNGDQTAVLVPGDTVNIIAGTYIITSKITLITDGKADSALVYQNFDDGVVVIDADDNSFVMLESNGDHVVIIGLELTNSRDHAIHVKGDFTEVTECYVHHIGKAGFRVEGNDCLFLRNLVSFATEEGFKNEGSGEDNNYYHNVAYSCGKMGFELKSDNSRVFNCISTLNDKGIKGDSKNICGFNDVWSNTTADYESGVVDSAGGISDDPLYVNPVGGNFRLQGNSPCVNTGLDLGYPYDGPAPDMGANESNFGANSSPPRLSKIGSKSVIEGDNLNFEVSATDLDGTIPALEAENLPDNSSFIDNSDGTGEFDFNPDFDQAGIYEVLFLADDGEFADSELVEITVENYNNPPVIDSIGPKTVAEGQNLNFVVSASDADGTIPDLKARNVPSNATFDDNEDGTGQFDFNPDFTQAGIYDVLFIADDGPLSDSETVQITVTLDELSYISIVPDSAIISADSTQQFSALGFSATDEERDPGTITWELTEPLGSIDEDGLFDAVTVGIGAVIASSDLGFIDTAYLEVTPGILATLTITPDRDTISADSTRQFAASGIDNDGNSVSALGDLTWEVLNSIGTISSGGLFDAVIIGDGFIRVTSDIGPIDVSDTITIIPGDPSYIDVVPDENLIAEGETYPFTALQYDSDSNLIMNITSTSTWTTTDASGSVSVTGLFTAGNVPSPPTYYVKAVESGLADSSSITVLSSGSLDYVRIEREDGTPFGDTSLTTDNDTTILYCRGYDSGNSLLGDISVDWSLLSGEPIGSVPAEPSSNTTLTLSQIGTGEIVASYSGSVADTSGMITCIAGVPASLVISPDTATITSDSSIQFTIQTFDADNNISSPVIIDSWNVIGDIGDISNTGLFDAITPGTGQITCTGGGLSDTTGNIVVLGGVLSLITISPDSLDIAIGSIDSFEVEGWDADSNAADVGNLTWSVIGGIGVIDSDGVFTAQNVGSGRIAVTSDINGVTDTNQVVNVLAGALEIIIVTPDTASLAVSESVNFIASGFDNNFEPMPMGDLTWEVIGGIGTIDENGLFNATAKGAGKISVSSSIRGIADTTNMIVVEIPTITEIPLGNYYARPNQRLIPVLAFRITNAFDEVKQFDGITLNNASRGTGSNSQVLSNFDSLTLYLDSDDNSILSASDQPITRVHIATDQIHVSFSAVNIPPAASRTFFVGMKANLYPHDGDSMDIFLKPATDIDFDDGTVIAGPDSINSLGYCLIDGIVAEQVTIVPSGNSTINPASGAHKVMTVDIPRNGYESDTLKILSVSNDGTAGSDDLESLTLYIDDGDNVWDGISEESQIGTLAFTGGYWSISGISQPLTQIQNRFYITATPSMFPSSGTSLILGIPPKGIEMASDNDGPVDEAVSPVDTFSIITSESVSFNAIDIPSQEIVPGENTDPLFGFELINGYSYEVDLNSIEIKLYANDPDGATQTQLNSQIDDVLLLLNRDGDYAEHGSTDSLLATGQIIGGTVTFNSIGLTLPANGSVVGLFVECIPDLNNSKNANTINFGIAGSDDISLGQSAAVSGVFPMKNSQEHQIDAFPAANIQIYPIEGSNLYGGITDQTVLNFTLPSDGYSSTVLTELNLENLGSASSPECLEAVKLWQDVDANGYSASDVLVGTFTNDGSSGEDINLSIPLSTGSNRFCVTVDVADTDFEGGTLQFQIPVGGVTYQSGTVGPDDQATFNPESHFLLPANRITVISIPQDDVDVYPGTNDLSILTFALYNGYTGQAHELTNLRLTNQSISASTNDFADYSLGQVSLYFDRNGNRTFDNDSLMAVGYFNDGILSLNGFEISLLPEALSYFFVIADLPPNIIDDDTLAISLQNHSDLSFSQSVRLNGDLPLTRGGSVVIDGSVLSQYEIVTVPSQTLTQGDLSVPLFAFKPAFNGNLSDILQSLTIKNYENADTNDISALTLWLDQNGNNRWEDSDLSLGSFGFTSDEWTINNLNLPIDSNRQTLLVVADISSDARANKSFQAMIPVNGCKYNSNNDGPLDADLLSEQTFVISESGLKITYDELQQQYSVGQTIDLTVRVTNLLSTTIDDVYCDIIKYSEPNIVDLENSYTGPSSIGPGETVVFYHSYTAADQGSVSWLLQAYSEIQEETTVPIETETVMIQTIPTDIDVHLISSIPASVIRGQTHIFPFSLSLSHSDTSSNSASLRLDSLRISFEDGNGSSKLADEICSRLILSSGYMNLAILEAIPSQSTLLLEFTNPAIFNTGEEQLLSLMIDIDSSAEIGEFAIVIENENDIALVENNSGLLVTLDEQVHFPLQTASCRIDEPSHDVAISYNPVLNNAVNYGQDNIDVLELVLRHPGSLSSSQVQLTELSFEFIDSTGTLVNPEDFIDNVMLSWHNSIIGYLANPANSNDRVEMQLSAPPVIAPGETDTIVLHVSLKDISENSSFGIRIADSTAFSFRDLSSGLALMTTSDIDSLSTSTVFPIHSGYSDMNYPSTDLSVCLLSEMPASIVGGADSITLLKIPFEYSVTDEYASLILENIEVTILDSFGVAIDPLKLFDRIGYRLNDGEIYYQPFIVMNEGFMVFSVDSESILIEPGQEGNITLLADVESDTPYDNFKIMIKAEHGLNLRDANDDTREIGFFYYEGCDEIFPFFTDATRIFLPAGRPGLAINPTATRITYPGETGVSVLSGELSYEGSEALGDLIMTSWQGQVLRRNQDGTVAISADQVFTGVHLYINNQRVITNSSFSESSFIIEISEEYVIEHNTSQNVKLVCDMNPHAELGNYIINLSDSTCIEFADRNLLTPMYSVLVNESFPVSSCEISLSAPSLQESFVNYPNPFNPDVDLYTRIAYVLDEQASVDIEIFTISGEEIYQVSDNVARTSGSYSDDRWNGMNADGLVVLPGTYFCRIKARYDSGRTEEFLRKISVVR
jgi:hypothetical protein